MHRSSGLNVLCAAIALWNTVYAEIADEHLHHLSTLDWEHVPSRASTVGISKAPRASGSSTRCAPKLADFSPFS